MLSLLQRVTTSTVTIDGVVVGQIGRGVLVFVGVEKSDGEYQNTPADLPNHHPIDGDGGSRYSLQQREHGCPDIGPELAGEIMGVQKLQKLSGGGAGGAFAFVLL